MKARESGMPDEAMWSGFFDPPQVLAKLGLTAGCRAVVDLGCGYGTFTIPAARMIRGIVHAMDIDADMIAATMAKARAEGLTNVSAIQRDFVADETGLAEGSADYVMLFNILHAEEPVVLLRESWRVLGVGGRLGVMHWNYDAGTPRGPSMGIRPRPGECRRWAEEVGFRGAGAGEVDLPPYHYGFVMRKA